MQDPVSTLTFFPHSYRGGKICQKNNCNTEHTAKKACFCSVTWWVPVNCYLLGRPQALSDLSKKNMKIWLTASLGHATDEDVPRGHRPAELYLDQSAHFQSVCMPTACVGMIWQGDCGWPKKNVYWLVSDTNAKVGRQITPSKMKSTS